MEQIFFEAKEEDQNKRIDRYLSEQLADTSRSYIQKLIGEKLLCVNEMPVKSNYKLTKGDTIWLSIPDPVELEILPENIPLDILYEDEDVLVVNKPKGMVVHPSAGHYTGTLVNALLYHCKDQLSSINGVLRPGIVHRIDMDTTGALVVCKNNRAHQSLSEQLHEHSITRRYQAIVWNNITEEQGTIDQPIGRHPIDRKKMSIHSKSGKRAVTHYHVLQRFGRFCHVECVLETGRTHQIRVHMASIGHPLLGDAVYGPAKDKFALQGQCLHAKILGFIHPSSGKYMEFEAPTPVYFDELLHRL